MQTLKATSLWLAAGLLAGLVTTGSALAAAGTPAAATSAPVAGAGPNGNPDTVLTAEVRDKLTAAGYRDVNVAAKDGVVTLMGSASTPDVKANVTAVAKSVDGVKDVDNSRLMTPAERQQQKSPPH